MSKLYKLVLIFVIFCLYSCSNGNNSVKSNSVSPPPFPNNPTLISLQISPGNTTLGVGGTLQFKAIAHYSNGSSTDVTQNAIWTSSNNFVAGASSSGLVTAINVGSSTIIVKYGNITSTPISITVASLAIINIKKLPYSMPISESATAIFLVQNFTGLTYQLSSVNIYPSASIVINPTNTTCGSELAAYESCIYSINYTSPASLVNSGVLVDVGVQINVFNEINGGVLSIAEQTNLMAA